MGFAGVTWRVVLLLSVLAGCALPANTGLSDWARGAAVAVVRPLAGIAPEPASDDATQAMQQAVANYLFALALLADDGHFAIREEEFATLAARVAVVDAPAAADIAALALPLRAAAAEARPFWLPPSPSGPQAELNDSRPPRLVLAADPPVQRLLAAISRPIEGAGEADAIRHLTLLRHIAAGHALLSARADRLTQRETEILLRGQSLRLRHALAEMPPDPNPLAPGQAIASVLPP